MPAHHAGWKHPAAFGLGQHLGHVVYPRPAPLRRLDHACGRGQTTTAVSHTQSAAGQEAGVRCSCAAAPKTPGCATKTPTGNSTLRRTDPTVELRLDPVEPVQQRYHGARRRDLDLEGLAGAPGKAGWCQAMQSNQGAHVTQQIARRQHGCTVEKLENAAD